MTALADRARQLLRIQRVAGAYRTLFLGKEAGTPGADVLADLRAFCWPMGSEKPKAAQDALALARAEGRREVFERVMTLSHGSLVGIETEIVKLKEMHGD